MQVTLADQVNMSTRLKVVLLSIAYPAAVAVDYLFNLYVCPECITGRTTHLIFLFCYMAVLFAATSAMAKASTLQMAVATPLVLYSVLGVAANSMWSIEPLLRHQ